MLVFQQQQQQQKFMLKPFLKSIHKTNPDTHTQKKQQQKTQQQQQTHLHTQTQIFADLVLMIDDELPLLKRSSEGIWHIRDKLWSVPKHGSITLLIRKVYPFLAVTCHLHRFWQNDRDFLRATVVTRGWNGYRNKSQHRKSTLEKKILPPFQQGFEPATFQSRVRCSNYWAIPAPRLSAFSIAPVKRSKKARICWYRTLQNSPHIYPFFKSIHKTKPYTNIKMIHIHKHKFRRISAFSITPIKRVNKAGKCWCRRPFRLIYQYQVKE